MPESRPDQVPPVLNEETYLSLDRSLATADAAHAHDYPGDDGQRQPVHTVYVAADRYHPGLPAEWGAAAARAIADNGIDPATLADLLTVGEPIAADVLARITAKLASEPIEDLRIDFEDGFGQRSDEDEDAAATAAGTALAASSAGRPPFTGIRFKSLEPATRRRGVRTIDLFLAALLADQPLPAGFALTLPKVTHVDQVRAFVDVCAALEAAHGLSSGALRFEVQIETPQAIVGADGRAPIAELVHLGRGRLRGLHYGTYDYSAATGVAAPYQSLEHPVADYAKAVMQVAAAGTGVTLSDGSTNVVPVGSSDKIVAAWRLHARLVRRSLERGYYQGWDLHPLQLVTRFAATYAFYREGLPSAAARLRAYLDRSAGATMDEPATAQAMAALLVRGLHCGALDEAEVREGCGLDRDALERIYRRRIG
jgi:citrate lyase beta subunit